MTLNTTKQTGDEVSAAEWNESATAANKVTDSTLEAINISDFDVEVSNNVDVAANTLKVTFDTDQNAELSTTGSPIFAEVNVGNDANPYSILFAGDRASINYAHPYLSFRAGATRGLKFLVNDADEIIRILSTGEVGIGTITPTEALDVIGNIKLNSAELVPKVIGNSGTSKTIPLVDGGIQTITIDQATTLTITSMTNGGRSSLTLSGADSFAVTVIGVTWLTVGGIIPTFDGNDVVTFLDDGTTIWAAISNQS